MTKPTPKQYGSIEQFKDALDNLVDCVFDKGGCSALNEARKYFNAEFEALNLRFLNETNALEDIINSGNHAERERHKLIQNKRRKLGIASSPLFTEDGYREHLKW